MAGYLNCLLLITMPETKTEGELLSTWEPTGMVQSWKTCIWDLKAESRSSCGLDELSLHSLFVGIDSEVWQEQFKYRNVSKLLFHGLCSNRNTQKMKYFTKKKKSIFLDARKSVKILKFFDVAAQHTFKQYDYMGILKWTEYQNE